MTKLFRRLILVSGILLSAPPLATAEPLTPPGPVSALEPSQEMQVLLDEYASLSPLPFHLLRVSEARRQPTLSDAVASLLAKSGRVPDTFGLALVNDITIATSRADLPARVYRPVGDGILPVILYFQNGGWVIGDLDVYETSAVALAKKTGAIVVSVEYRKAPEHKFPSAHDDAFRAYKWLIANAARFGGDATRIAVAGEGAGGNLAVNVAIRARDERIPQPRHILAICPVADGTGNTPSYAENRNAKPLSRAKMMWFFAQYFNIQSEARDPRISLLRADIRNLPPTTILVAELDPLRSEGTLFAWRLRDANAPVEFRLYTGVTHDFFGAGDVLSEARAAQSYAAARIKASFKATL